MKIIGGTLKGRNFFMPQDIRPTQNITRKALFDILGQSWEGNTLLELFAGSGAVGLEALSRDAASVVFVENDYKCVDVINENIELLKIDKKRYQVVDGDAFSAIQLLAKEQRKFDFVFLDPPYGRDLAKKALNLLGAHVILHANSVVILEHQVKDFLPSDIESLILFDQRTYGKTILSFYKLQS